MSHHIKGEPAAKPAPKKAAPAKAADKGGAKKK